MDKCWIQLCAAVLLISLSLNTRTPAIAQEPTIVQEPAPAVVSSSIPGVPEILARIARCESGGRQFNDDGSVVRGKANPQDIGKWQVNLRWNGETARRLGYDLFTEEGNTLMALYLYKTRGTRDWRYSYPCWGSS